MAFGDADRDVFLADFGVDVTIGSTTITGVRRLEDVPREGLDGVQVLVRRESVVVKTGAVANPAIDSAITVDGTAFKVRSVESEPPDGAFTRIVYA